MLSRSVLLFAAAKLAGAAIVGRPLFLSHPPLVAVRAARASMCTEVAPTVPPFAFLDVRVGKIVEAWPHSDSEKLWCEKIDVGEAEPREIASGIRAYYKEASDLVGARRLSPAALTRSVHPRSRLHP